MPQAKYTVSDDVTLFVTSPSSSAAASSAALTSPADLPLSSPFSSSTLEMDRFSMHRPSRRRRFSSWLARKMAGQEWIFFTLLVLFIATTFGLSLYLLLHVYHNSSTTASTVKPPAAGDHIPEYHFRRRFQAVTRDALWKPGQVIASAASSASSNCTLAMTYSSVTGMYDAPVVARCRSWLTTRWYLNGNRHDCSPFTLHPTENSVHCLKSIFSSFLSIAPCLEIEFLMPILFTLNVESVSVVGQSRVYFSLRGEVGDQDECVEMQNSAEHGLVFLLEPCSADKVTQLFYLDGIDYSEVFAEYQKWMAENISK
ncbi:hypothetical protein TYRP_006491 [Tyrophagus putrescentiae]|nr:hypothetical protein TYRP_006491 [Tyrophagus putrescentiae]